jgi:hypothetical protein
MTLPQEAREGVMRAFLSILSERHPHVTWVPAGADSLAAELASLSEEMTAEDQVAPTGATRPLLSTV